MKMPLRPANPFPLRRPLGTVALLAVLAAMGGMALSCGGGGGGGSSTPPPPPPPASNAIAVGEVGSYGTMNNVFSPATLTVNAGTTVTWNWATDGHTVDSGSSCTPDGLYSSNGAQSAGFTMSHAFTVPGSYPYYCTTHCGMGMTGTVLVNAPTTTIQVGQSGATFSPDTLTIRAGQTVTWQWAGSGHSVVSGTSCTADGLFSSGGDQNAGFTMSHPFNTPGTFPYFCAPHCGIGMTGTVVVKP